MEIHIKKIKCHICGHIWITKTTREVITCPNCQYKVRVDKDSINNVMV